MAKGICQLGARQLGRQVVVGESLCLGTLTRRPEYVQLALSVKPLDQLVELARRPVKMLVKLGQILLVEPLDALSHVPCGEEGQLRLVARAIR